MVGKINSILNFIDQEKPDIISLNEIRTNSTTESYIYEVAKLGYFPLIRSRKVIEKGKIVTDEKDLNGGGVALLIKDTIVITQEFELPANKLSIEERSQIEIIGASIKVGEIVTEFVNQ